MIEVKILTSDLCDVSFTNTVSQYIKQRLADAGIPVRVNNRLEMRIENGQLYVQTDNEGATYQWVPPVDAGFTVPNEGWGEGWVAGAVTNIAIDDRLSELDHLEEVARLHG